ncbi:hypothetical protein HRG_010520 [Hirsutella rhossiliensis]|uniref:SSCRP protein n=1 Tax=Hirsutella rhossiliensis TaxID=111463 RepID=A0A9P8SDQ8_9HYPO|nr:uncharacterized protein HRG_10520 [Hirsutella rhossiliensis]KAH0958219.1 hypothetical protein HRG_10520 [Hirsutella rhossiliensis]
MNSLLIALAALALAQPQVITPASLPPPLSPVSVATILSPDQAPAPPKPSGPICECGYTYCASVLMKMKMPWNQKQLAEAYCKTPNAPCSGGTPGTDVKSALYLCLCNDANQGVGNELHLLCGCDKCLVIEPDFRGRCESPCHAGPCGK